MEVTMVSRGIQLQNSPWWKSSYLSNHLWIGCAAVLATAVAVSDNYDEIYEKIDPEIKDLVPSCSSIEGWYSFANSKMDSFFSMAPDDGSLHEGASYYSYGIEFIQYYVSLAEKFCGKDFSQNAFLKNTHKFISNMMIPRTAGEKSISVYDFGDCSDPIDYGNIQLLYYLADKYKSSNAFEYAKFLESKAGDNGLSSSWKVLLFNVGTAYPAAYEPSTQQDTVFYETGYAFSTSASNLNESGSSVAFKCGPPGGVKVSDAVWNYGLSHVHGDNNSFILYYNNYELLTDDGYTSTNTSKHNTLVINGAGQYGEDTESGDKWKGGYTIKPKIVNSTSHDRYFYVPGDATESYPEERGLESYKRHLVFLKPNVLLIIDDISMKEANNATLTLNFHPKLSTMNDMLDGRTINLSSDEAQMNIQSFSNDFIINNSYSKHRGKYRLAVESTDKNWRHITAVSWGGAYEKLPEIQVADNNGIITAKVDCYGEDNAVRNITIDTTSNAVSSYTEKKTSNLLFSHSAESFVVNGISEAGNMMTVQVHNPLGELVYLDQTVADDGGRYEFEFNVAEKVNGRYLVKVYDPVIGNKYESYLHLYEGSNYRFSDISMSQSDHMVHAKVECENVWYEDKTLLLIIAAYSNGGKILKDARICPYKVGKDQSITASLSMEKSAEYDKYKLFVLDEDIYPMIDLKEYN